jgi:hypothetical protein
MVKGSLATCQIYFDAAVEAVDAAAHTRACTVKWQCTVGYRPELQRGADIQMSAITIRRPQRQSWQCYYLRYMVPPRNTNAVAAEVTIDSLLSKNQLSL